MGTITESHIEGAGDRVLLRLAVKNSALLDVFTNEETLGRAREFLSDPGGPQQGGQEMRLGSFGPFAISMSRVNDDPTVAIFLNGPDLGNEFRGNQSAGLYVLREELLNAISPRR